MPQITRSIGIPYDLYERVQAYLTQHPKWNFNRLVCALLEKQIEYTQKEKQP